MSNRSYEDLVVWQRAMDLAMLVYQLWNDLPSDERHGLAWQLKRAAVSVPSNIAEGWSRSWGKAYLHCLTIARGPIYELKTQGAICSRLGYAGDWNTFEEAADEVGRLL